MYQTINETGIQALEASLIDDVVRRTENGVDTPVAHGGGVALDTWKRRSLPRLGARKPILICCRRMRLFLVLTCWHGKTYVAVAKAVESLKKREVERIILSRPAVEAGERLGFFLVT